MATSTTTAFSFLSNDFRDDNTDNIPYRGTSIRSTRTNLNLHTQGEQQFKFNVGGDEPTITAQMGGYKIDTEGNRSLLAFANSHNAISMFDIENHVHSQNMPDHFISSNWGAVNRTTIDGKDCIDLSSQAYITNSTAPVLGQYYTLFAVWYPRVSNSGWRTLWRGDNDHKVIVNNNATDLGMYSNRNGAFRDTGHNISIQWQRLIVVGQGTGSTSSTGTQTFYIDGQNVGTTDRVGSGTTFNKFGWEGQAPGYFMEIGVLDEALSTSDVATLDLLMNATLTANGSSGNTGLSFSQSLSPDQNLITYNSGTFTNFTHSEKLAVLNPSVTQIKSNVPQPTTTISKEIRIAASNKIQPTLQSGGGVSGGGGGGTVERQVWY